MLHSSGHDSVPFELYSLAAIPSRLLLGAPCSLSHNAMDDRNQPLATGFMHISLCSTVLDTDLRSCPRPLKNVAGLLAKGYQRPDKSSC